MHPNRWFEPRHLGCYNLKQISLAPPSLRRPISQMKVLPHTRSCFVCGESNPLGLNLRFETDGRIVHARFTPRPEHIGFRDTVHGGIIATLLDEIMVWACAVPTKKFAFCAEMNVRFLKPTRPRNDLLAKAELVSNRKDKLFEARAELKTQSGEVLATATGKYFAVRNTEAVAMASDFVDDAAWLFEADKGGAEETSRKL